MPPKKRGGKTTPKGKGRGRGKKVEEEVPEEEAQSEEVEESQDDSNADTMDTSQDSAASNDVTESQDDDQEQDTAEEEQEQDDSEGGGQKRKAEENGDDENEDESSSKRAKTEDDADKPITLFCGNLDQDLTTETLSGFFETNGIEVTNPRKIGFKRFGYVDVKPEDLDRAIEMNGKELNGEPITIEKSKPRQQDPQGGRVQGGDSKTLFVKGFKETTTEDDLKNFFEDKDEGIIVTEIRLPKNREGMSKGFGYVVFESEDLLENIIKEKQDAEMDGDKLFLDYTDEKSKHGGKGGNKEFGPSKVLFVRNLAFQVSEEELKDIFEGCEACRIPPNEYGQSKGFGFVEFKSVEDAQSAKKDKDGLEINGRVVQLAFANDKPGGAAGARSGGMGGYGGYGGGGGGGRFGGGRGGGGRGGGGWGGGGGRGGGGWGGGGFGGSPRRGGGGGYGGGGGWGGGGGRGGGGRFGGGGGGGRGGRGGGGWGGGGGGGRGGRGGGGGFNNRRW